MAEETTEEWTVKEKRRNDTYFTYKEWDMNEYR